jgi:hypothetical protein
VGLLLICAGCVMLPDGSVPDGSAPEVPLPSTTRFLGRATAYVSAAGERLEIVHDTVAGNAVVKLPGGGIAVLPAEIAGVEGRYRDDRMTVWELDGAALLWVEGKLVFNGRATK